MTQELHTARRRRDEAVATFGASTEESVKLIYLQRALEVQQEVVRLDTAIREAYEPCRACGRKVASPCHSLAGYCEDGPWDGSCAAVFGR